MLFLFGATGFYQKPDAYGRDFRCAIAPLKCGRNLRFPHKRPLPKMPPAGGSVSWRPPVAERAGGHLFPSHSSTRRTKVFPNPCRKAHRNYSLFPIHYSLSTRPARRHTAPRQTHPTPRERQRIAPRRGALTSWARSLSRLRACEFGMSADFERELLPAGASLFHGDMIK